MNYQDLRDALSLTSGTLTITRDSLGSALASFLDTCYQGQPIVISGAALGPGDGTSQTLEVVGSAALSGLGCAGVPVTARFYVDSGGQVQALLRYQLLGGAAGATGWTFGRSFPSLPREWNHAAGPPPDDDEDPAVLASRMAQQRSYLDALPLTSACCVISSCAGPDPVTGVPLSAGINPIVQANGPGMLGVLEPLISSSLQPMTMYGVLRSPVAGALTTALLGSQAPWDRSDLPGISLQAPLSLQLQVGRLVLDQVAFRLYTPLSKEWQAANPSFYPAHGYSARLSIPSAGLTVQLSAEHGWNQPEALLTAACQGVTLGKLAHLVDLTGSGSLSSLLPAELSSAADALSQLQLTSLALAVRLDGTTPSIGMVSVGVGLPGLCWKVLGDSLQVQDLGCRFDVPQPGSAGTGAGTVVTLTGTLLIEGVPLKIEARSDHGFSVYAKLGSAQTLPLASLFSRYAPGLPAPGNLSVSSLAVQVSPGRSYAMAMLLADSPAWQIPLGPASLSIRDVQVALSSAAGRTTGVFSGTIDVGGVALSMSQTVPGPLVLKATCPSIRLSRLVSALTSGASFLPADLDFKLQNPSILIDVGGSTPTFQVAALVPGLGTVVFEAVQVSGTWGCVFGIALSGKMSSVPGLSGLAALDGLLAVNGLTLVAASVVPPGFTFPALSSFGSPALGSANLTAPATGLVAGLNLYGSMTLGQSSGLQVVQKLLGLSPDTVLTLAAQIGKNPALNSMVQASISGQINSKVSLTGTLGAALRSGTPSLFVNAKVTAPIQGQACIFTASMLIDLSPPGAFLSGTMQGSIRFSGITLSDLGLLIGVGSNGLPSVGVAATVTMGKFNGSAAIFLDTADPSQSMLAGSISDLSLKDVADTMAGVAGFTVPPGLGDALAQVQVSGTQTFALPLSGAVDLNRAATNLNADTAAAVAAIFLKAKLTLPSDPRNLLVTRSTTPGKWFVTDLSVMRHYQLVREASGISGSVSCQLYVAPRPTAIGTFKYPQGFYLNGKLTICGYSLTATIQVSQSKGISIDASMSPITLRSPSFFSLTGADGKSGPLLSIATYRQPNLADTKLQQPHLLISGRLSLLGCSQNLYISITSSGLVISAAFTTKVVNWTVDGSIDRSGDLSLSGDISIDLKNVPPLDMDSLGKVRLDTKLSGSLAMECKSGKARASLSGDVALGAKTFSTGTLSVTSSKLDELPQSVADALKPMLKKSLEDLDQWLGWVKDGTLQGVGGIEQIGRVIHKNFSCNILTTAAKLKWLGYEAVEIGAALKALGQEAYWVCRALYSAEFYVNDMGRALKSAFDLDDDKMASYLHGLGYSPTEVAGVLKSVWRRSSGDMAKVLDRVGYGARDVTRALKWWGGVTWDDAYAILSSLGYGWSYILDVLEDEF